MAQSAPLTEEQGTTFKQNMAIMRDTLRKDVAPPSLPMIPQAEPLLALPRAEPACMEVPFSPYIAKRLAELSADLRGEVDGHESGLSGEEGPQKGKLLPKPKAKMDAYRVGCEVFSFVTVNSRNKTRSLFLWQTFRE